MTHGLSALLHPARAPRILLDGREGAIESIVAVRLEDGIARAAQPALETPARDSAHGLGARDGCVIEGVTAAEAEKIQRALATPNGGVRLSLDHLSVEALPAPKPVTVIDPTIALKLELAAPATADAKIAVLAQALGL